jgi:hypothetical protein
VPQTFRCLILLSLAVTLGACSNPPAESADPASSTVTGTVRYIGDASQLDGPIVIMIESPPGDTVDLHFGSMFTKPAPNAARQATFATIQRTRVGDRVRAYGSRIDAGLIWLERLENLDRN